MSFSSLATIDNQEGQSTPLTESLPDDHVYAFDGTPLDASAVLNSASRDPMSNEVFMTSPLTSGSNAVSRDILIESTESATSPIRSVEAVEPRKRSKSVFQKIAMGIGFFTPKSKKETLVGLDASTPDTDKTNQRRSVFSSFLSRKQRSNEDSYSGMQSVVPQDNVAPVPITKSPPRIPTRRYSSAAVSRSDMRKVRRRRCTDGAHAVPSMCIRIQVHSSYPHMFVNPLQLIDSMLNTQVRVKSTYRICAADPQDETEDTWATASGCLDQLFFIKSNCNGRPAISDRLVTVTFGRLESSIEQALMGDLNDLEQEDILSDEFGDVVDDRAHLTSSLFSNRGSSYATRRPSHMLQY